jgi:NAD(P)H-hydrate repair Nnr-like enzyme with NAD(P)H-hydrate dehydratase domain
MPGASVLAAEAGLRGGAGHVKVMGEGAQAPAELVVNSGPLSDSLADPRIATVLVGPGLGRDGNARGRLEAVLAMPQPKVLDADALVLLRTEDAPLGSAVLTPHMGELGALERAFGVDGTGLRRERALAVARATGAVVVLAGIVASRLATHGDPLRAAEEGLWLHGEAARLAGPALTPTALVEALPSAVSAALV